MKKFVVAGTSKILVLLLVLSFAIWGVGGILGGVNRDTVITVGDTQVSAREFSVFLQKQLTILESDSLHPDMRKADLRQQAGTQVLRQFIVTATLDNDVKERGLSVTDEAVMRSVIANPAFRGSSETFDPETFMNILDANRMSEAEYLIAERKVHKRRQIPMAISIAFYVPEIMVRMLYDFATEQRRLAYVTFTPDMIAPVKNPDSRTIESFFTLRKEQFRSPQCRKIELLELNPVILAQSFKISDSQLRNEYESRKDSFRTQERRQVEQIMFDTMQEAQAALGRIRSGAATFTDIARERDLTDKDLALGLLEQGDFVNPHLGTEAFSIDLHSVSDPIEGRTGVAVIRVTDIQQARVRSFVDVSEELRSNLSLQSAREGILDVYDEIENRLLSGTSFSKIAEMSGVSYISPPCIDSRGSDPDGNSVSIPASALVLERAFSIEPGIETEPIALDDENFLWINVLSITPEHDRSLEQVYDKVQDVWKEEEIRKRLAFKAHGMLRQLKAGRDFDSLAAEMRMQVRVSPWVGRTSVSDGIFPDAVLNTAFITPQDGFSMSENESELVYTVFQVRDIESSDFDPSSEVARNIRENLNSEMIQERLSAYLESRQQEFGISFNEELIMQLLR